MIAVVSPAHNYTASLGSYVTFNCTTTGADEVWWMVDGLRATTHEIAGRDIQRTKYSYTSTGIETELRVAATVENNETSIYCFGIVFDSKNFFSETLTFHVQGKLQYNNNVYFSCLWFRFRACVSMPQRALWFQGTVYSIFSLIGFLANKIIPKTRIKVYASFMLWQERYIGVSTFSEQKYCSCC